MGRGLGLNVVIGLILVLCILSYVMCRVGLFNWADGMVTSTGFKSVKPQLAANHMYSNGDFSGIFTNGAGKNISIKGVTLENAAFEKNSCYGDVMPLSVGFGENFEVNASKCAEAKGGFAFCFGRCSPEPYNIRVNITYDAEGVEAMESGTIRGPIENPDEVDVCEMLPGAIVLGAVCLIWVVIKNRR